jgi:hypothetical protein
LHLYKLKKNIRLFPIIPDLLRLLPTQPATNPSPKGQKQPKTSLYKMQLQPFFFYRTTNILRPKERCAKSDYYPSFI